MAISAYVQLFPQLRRKTVASEFKALCSHFPSLPLLPSAHSSPPDTSFPTPDLSSASPGHAPHFPLLTVPFPSPLWSFYPFSWAQLNHFSCV